MLRRVEQDTKEGGRTEALGSAGQEMGLELLPREKVVGVDCEPSLGELWLDASFDGIEPHDSGEAGGVLLLLRLFCCLK